MSIELPTHIDESIRAKLLPVVNQVNSILPDDEGPVEAFVSTTSTRGELNYDGVWIFTPKLIVEIRNPLRQARIQYEIARFTDSVDWIRLSAVNYEFGAPPTDESQLDLEFTTTDGLSKFLSANGKGCCHLMKLYNDRFLRNFTGTRD